MNEPEERSVRSLLKGKSDDKLFKLVREKRRTNRNWVAGPDIIADARKELVNECLLMVPDMLGRLRALVNDGSDTAAVQAIKVLLKLWENLEVEGEEERVINSLVGIIERTLKELDVGGESKSPPYGGREVEDDPDERERTDGE